MKVSVSFGCPFAATVYTVALLLIGWTIGAHWGHTLSSGLVVFLATIFLLLHDAATAILLAMAAIKAAPWGRK